MSNESSGAEKREVCSPTLRAAMQWAALGAALFLGVGAALPVWNRHELLQLETAPLWQVIRLRMDGTDRYRDPGVMIYTPGYGDLIAGSVRLLACGAVVGVLGYGVWLVVKRDRRKGGGA